MNLRNLFARKAAAPKEQAAPTTAAMWSELAISQFVELLTRIPEIDEVLTNAGISRHSLRKLETDDEIFGALRTRRESVVSTAWRLEDGDEALTQLVEEELRPISNHVIADIWRAVPYGYSVLEGVYRHREDGKVGFKSVSDKPLQWFDPRPDGTLRYFAPDGGAQGVEVDQTYKFFLTRVEPTYTQPKGEALLARLYWPWFFRFNGWQFWGQFLERFGQPLIVGKSSDTKKMALALASVHQDAAIAVGTNDSVEAINPATAGEAFEKLEQCVVRRYQRLILGQTLTSDTGAKGAGSFALGKVHAEVKEGLRQADIRLVAATMQRIVNALCAANGATTGVPKFVMSDDAGLEADRASRDKDLSAIGVKFTKEYFLDRYDLREDDFEVSQTPVGPFGPGQGTTQPVEQPLDDASDPESGTKAKGGKVPTDENGDPTNPQAKASRERVTFGRRYARDPKRFTPGQQRIEDEADTALSVCGQPVDATLIRQAILAAKDPQDLEVRLAALMDERNPQFARTLEQALFAADVLGYVHAEGKL